MNMKEIKETSLEMTENTAVIKSLSHEGRGVAVVAGKTLFIDGALPAEKVKFKYLKKHKRFDEAKVEEIIEASIDRDSPICPHYEVCGGCSLQHLKPSAQLRIKQDVVVEQLKHFGKVSPQTLLPPISGQNAGYRRKARLGVKFVTKKDKVLVGFREKNSGLLADLDICKVLHPSVGTRLSALKALIISLEAYQHIPQIEVAVGDEQSALVFRHLSPLSEKDKQTLIDFGKNHQLSIYLQAEGPDSVIPLWQANSEQTPPTLFYRLPKYQLQIHFKPTDFIQVNAEINQQLIDQVIKLLELNSEDKVLDLFCGLGNFTLPMARIAAKVVGVEVCHSAIMGAKQNALYNDIHNVEFYLEDLQKETSQKENTNWKTQTYTKVFLDPPRTGAWEILPFIQSLNVSRIVYVSCNPATLARDLNQLVHQFGFELMYLGVLDMFPQTSHIESIVVLNNPKYTSENNKNNKSNKNNKNKNVNKSTDKDKNKKYPMGGCHG